MRSHVWMGIGLIAGLLLGLLAAALSQRGHPGLAALVRSLRPVGSLFLNRGGSAVFRAVAVVFVARLYGIPFGISEMVAASVLIAFPTCSAR